MAKKKKEELLLNTQQPEQSSKEVVSQSEKEVKNKKESYISWTNPIYVQANGRWEFYQQDQEKQVLEVYHSESEEEIRTMHKSKVMSHIMAAMHQPKQKGERKKEGEKITIQEVGEHKGESKGIEKKDSSTYLHQDAKFTIMKMKLEGYMYHEIINEVKVQFGLSVMSISLYFTQVLNEIREKAKGKIDQTINDHLERYEDLFKWFRENGYSKAALKALERKEKLVGMHDGEKVDSMVLNGLVEKGLGKGRYDWEQLSETERVRLIGLVKKCIIILKPLNKDTEE